MAAAIKGYKLKLVMPSNMSKERQASMRAYGAELTLVAAGAMEKARDLAQAMQVLQPCCKLHRVVHTMSLLRETQRVGCLTDVVGVDCTDPVLSRVLQNKNAWVSSQEAS